MICATRAPAGRGRPKGSARSLLTSWITTPSQPRRTAPSLLSCSTTSMATSTGMAKDRPMKPPERVNICELIPTTSPCIEQRASGVTRVDGHVGLDERHIAFVRQAAPLGTDDAGGDRIFETKRRADRQHPLARLEISGLAHAYHRQLGTGINLQQRQVR